MKRYSIALLAIIAFLYIGGYAWFRQTHIEVWERDNNAYVIFPAGSTILYYAFRPLTYWDSMLTGMRFHIGPHQ